MLTVTVGTILIIVAVRTYLYAAEENRIIKLKQANYNAKKKQLQAHRLIDEYQELKN